MATTFSAYGVYWYDTSEDTAVGYGMAGRIRDNGSAIRAFPGMKPGLNGDPKVEGFVDTSGNLRVAVTDYVKGSQRDVYIHDAAFGTPLSTQSWPEDNLYTLVKLGNYLYAIDYDNAKVIEIDASTYAATGTIYTLAVANPALVPSGFQACGQALIVHDGRLYGLFAFPDSAWNNYANSLIVRFAITVNPQTGKNVISVDASNGNLAPNAFSIASGPTYSSVTPPPPPSISLYVAAIGGKQSSTVNTNSRIQMIDSALTSVTSLLSPNSNAFPYAYEFRDISFKGNTAYILAGTYNSSWKLVGRLVSTTDFQNFTLIDDFANVSTFADGYFWSAQYTPDNDRLWYTRGNDIRVFNANSTPPVPVGNPLTVTPGSLISTGDQYTDLNDLTYVGPAGTVTLRGYRSPLQRSRTPFAQAARALTQGRPELTEEEFQQLQAQVGH